MTFLELLTSYYFLNEISLNNAICLNSGKTEYLSKNVVNVLNVFFFLLIFVIDHISVMYIEVPWLVTFWQYQYFS